ncbi:sugar ABC transporter ATP-binding protein [Desulfospira joergensenii]|uniref:sugar ABC transporter ATP-binding protein n=1 Tax=Desulfospira joergensenii TaxID=53329 RepID=UPI0003B79C87|nr:sugar ABC transporter ATP-binding protein [Desulfospira joergensenii]
MLSLKKITKQYNGFTALDGVNLEVEPGRIHGLVGLNGSGKTTLLGIISGQSVIRETGGFSGSFEFNGKKRCFARPAQASAAGIGMVHQEFALIPGMDVAENISLSRESVKAWTQRLLGRDLSMIDPKANQKKAEKILDRLNPELDPNLLCADLPVAMKQFVEMARELNREPLKMLLLDEPTAVLGPADAGRLMDAVRLAAQKGTAVLYVSHRLEEVAACCHGITVLRNGRVAGCLENDPQDPGGRKRMVSQLSALMVGKKVFQKARKPKTNTNRPPFLEVASLSVDKPGDRLDHLDLTVYQGEILGITSLSGHGRTALGAGLFGLCRARGRVRLKSRDLTRFSPEEMIQNRVWMLPEDRREHGLLADHSIVENMTFAPVQTGQGFVKKGLPFFRGIDQKGCRKYARESVADLDIQCRSVFQKAGELSGGNQQKVCMAHAMAMDPDLLFVGDPTRGIDIAAKESVLRLLARTREEKGTTLVISSGEVEELRRICDRIAVFYRGQLFDILDPERDEADFTLACAGQREAL